MMRCPKCQKQYGSTWKFCVKCNIPLIPEEGSAQEVLAELNELKKISASLNERIKKLENQAVSMVKSEEVPVKKMEKIAIPVEEKATAVRRPEAEPKKTLPEAQSLESRIGRIWFNRIGILAIIIGMGFFLKYAFDNNWIGELGRVILGLLAGLGMIIGGEIAHRKNYNIFSEGLIAGGASLLYLSIYAAFNFYHLIGVIPAFFFLCTVIIFISTFAIRFNSSRILSLSICGGFLTPFLISVGGINPVTFMVYILLFDAGIFWVSYFKKWEHCNLLALVLTYLTYFSWYATKYEHRYFIAAESFISASFILFSLVAIIYNFVRKQATTKGDMAVVLFNGIFYFWANYRLLRTETIPLKSLGFISMALALIYLTFSYGAFVRTQGKDKNLILSYLSLTLLFATLSLPIELRHHWLTMGFIIESTILIWLGFKTQIKGLRTVGLILVAVALFKLLSMDYQFFHHYLSFKPILNMRFLTYLTLVAGVMISAYLYRQHKSKISKDETWVAKFLALSAIVLLWINFSSEINLYFDRLIMASRTPSPGPYPARASNITALLNARQFSLSAMWAVYSFLMIIIGIFRKFKGLRIMALGLFVVTIFKVFLIDISEIGRIWRILSFIGLGVILVITSLLYQRYKNKILEFIGKD